MKFSSVLAALLMAITRSIKTKTAVTSNNARGIMSGPPLSRISIKFCLPGAGITPARARLSFILEESITICKKNICIRSCCFIGVNVDIQLLIVNCQLLMFFAHYIYIHSSGLRLWALRLNVLFHHHGLYLFHR